MQTPNFEEGEPIGGRGWYYSKERWSVPISPPYILFLYQHVFARNFRLQFSVGVANANPRYCERGGGRWPEMVPFERALVSFYRPSIVTLTFPLSLRVSEILPLLFSSMPLFPYPTPIRAKIYACSLLSRSVILVSTESQVPKLIAVKLFLRNSNACDHNPPTSQTDGQTDRQLIMAIPRYVRYASRGKNCEIAIFWQTYCSDHRSSKRRFICPPHLISATVFLGNMSTSKSHEFSADFLAIQC